MQLASMTLVARVQAVRLRAVREMGVSLHSWNSIPSIFLVIDKGQEHLESGSWMAQWDCQLCRVLTIWLWSLPLSWSALPCERQMVAPQTLTGQEVIINEVPSTRGLRRKQRGSRNM